MATSRSAGSKAACVVPMRGEHPSPVGVLAEDGGLEQVVAGDAAAHLDRLVLADAAWRTVMAISWSAPSASVSSCIARSVQAWVSAAVKSSGVGVMPLAPLAMHGDGVVGGHAAVGVEPVEGDPGRRAQRGVEVGGGHDGVGGQHDQHRGQLRGEHAGALGHPADRPAGALDDGVSCGTESVVMIASAASGAAVGRQRRAAPRRRRRAGRHGRWRGRSGRSSRRRRRWRRCRGRSATCSAMACVVWKPSGPV